MRSLLILAGKVKIDEKLLPGQFGVGSVCGVEPPIHLLCKLAEHCRLVKIDFRNAFNAVDTTAVMNECRAEFPGLDSFVTRVRRGLLPSDVGQHGRDPDE